MKTTRFTILGLILLAAASSFAVSCADHRDDHMEDFQTMIYFRNGGEQDLTLYQTGEDGFYRVPVCKAGRDLKGKANVIVMPFDEAQMSMYNVKYETEYKLIPAAYYTFTDEERNPLADQDRVELKFGSSNPYLLVYLSLKTKELAQMMAADPDEEYVIGLQVFADENVSDEINLIVLKPGIEVPFVSLVTPGVESFKYTGESPDETTYANNKVTLNLDENRWDFTCSLKVADAAWLAEYNLNNGKSYTLLPASAYKLSTQELTFKAGELESSFDITIYRKNGMEMLTEYALPILLSSCSKEEFQIDEKKNLYLLNVRVDPDQIPLSADMVKVSHSETGYSGDAGGAAALVDGKEVTHWHTPWTADVTDPDPVYGMYIDIALKSELKAIVLEYFTRSGNNNGIPLHIVVGVSNDGASWSIIDGGDLATSEMASAMAGQWVTLPVLKHSTSFKYIRMGIAESASGDLRVPASGAFTALGELRLYGTADN